MIRELYKIPKLCKMKIIIKNTSRKNRKSSKSPVSILILADKTQVSFSGTSPAFSSENLVFSLPPCGKCLILDKIV